MGIEKPYRQIYRPIKEGYNSGYSSWAYIKHKDFADSPSTYTRAFLLLQNEIIDLFNYIEPCDINLTTYSLKIHELIIKICIEIEANFKSIFKANQYGKYEQGGSLNIRNDFYKIEKSHFLSYYTITYPHWIGDKNQFKPFNNWKEHHKLEWYQAYNAIKHDKVKNFEKANLLNLLNAFSALLVVLTSQYGSEDFSPGPDILVADGGGDTGIGNYLSIEVDDEFPLEKHYDFDWSDYEKDSNFKFQTFNYDNI